MGNARQIEAVAKWSSMNEISVCLPYTQDLGIPESFKGAIEIYTQNVQGNLDLCKLNDWKDYHRVIMGTHINASTSYLEPRTAPGPELHLPQHLRIKGKKKTQDLLVNFENLLSNKTQLSNIHPDIFKYDPVG